MAPDFRAKPSPSCKAQRIKEVAASKVFLHSRLSFNFLSFFLPSSSSMSSSSMMSMSMSMSMSVVKNARWRLDPRMWRGLESSLADLGKQKKVGSWKKMPPTYFCQRWRLYVVFDLDWTLQHGMSTGVTRPNLKVQRVVGEFLWPPFYTFGGFVSIISCLLP